MLIKNSDDIGELVRKARQAGKLSGPALGDKAGTGQAMVSRIEHGRANVTISTLIRIARALGKKLYISIK